MSPNGIDAFSDVPLDHGQMARKHCLISHRRLRLHVGQPVIRNNKAKIARPLLPISSNCWLFVSRRNGPQRDQFPMRVEKA